MSSSTELETFVRKFQQLWNNGYSAHLDLDCHDGVACVGLRLQLGHPPGPMHHGAYPSPPNRKYFSPSQKRRRERRNADAEEASSHKETVVPNENDKHTEEVLIEDNSVTVATIETEKKNDEVDECEKVEAEEATLENENDDEEQLAEKADEKENYEHTVAENEVDENEKELNSAEIVTVCQDGPISTPEVIAVFCTASLENCPDSTLNDEYGESIRRFLASEQHLAQNISSAELQHVTSKSCRNNLFTHTLSIVMYVRTARLWESPASYVRKHLGLTNYWTRSNGMIVRLFRIHQK